MHKVQTLIVHTACQSASQRFSAQVSNMMERCRTQADQQAAGVKETANEGAQ